MKPDKNYDDFLEKLANKIKELRLAKGLTQEDMIQFGFNYRHYQRLEGGKHSPSLHTIYKVSLVFNIPVGNLFR